MKYVVILGDGMADEPIDSLGNKTPLQVANKPTIDKIAALGRSGMLNTIPEGFSPGSEIANLSVLGYDVADVFEGRGSLEAASMGVSLEKGEMAMRCNLICIKNEKIKNHSAGHISNEEAAELIEFLNNKLGNENISFYHGVSYRHLLKMRGGNKNLKCTPPHDVPGIPFRKVMIKALSPDAQATADYLNELTLRSQELLENHPVNLKRAAEGKAQAAIEALRTDDFVYVHVEASDEAGHDGDVPLKIKTIEYLDARIVKPIFEEVSKWNEPVTIAVLPDHPTPCALRTHTCNPVPFVIYHPGETPDEVTTYDEFAARKGSYGLLKGNEFMKNLIGNSNL